MQVFLNKNYLEKGGKRTTIRRKYRKNTSRNKNNIYINKWRGKIIR
jgi:hypothetical protein